MRAAAVDANGGFLAFADDAHDAAAVLPALPELTATESWTALPLPSESGRGLLRRKDRRGLRAAGSRAAASAPTLLRPSGPLRKAAGDGDNLEVGVRDGIFVFLPEEPLLDEDVDRRREVTRPHLPLEEVYGPGVLLTAKDELRLLLALGLMAPDGHRHRHEHGHHADAHEQGRHRISALVALTL